MKKKDGLLCLINNILVGIDAVSYMFYMTIVLMAGVSSAHITYEEEAEIINSISRLSHIGICSAFFVAFIIIVIVSLNHYFHKNKNSTMLKVLCILLVMGFFVLLVRNILLFI